MHDWSFGKYQWCTARRLHIPHELVVDEADGSQVHTTTAGPSVTLGAHERTTVKAFTPWNGMMTDILQ